MTEKEAREAITTLIDLLDNRIKAEFMELRKQQEKTKHSIQMAVEETHIKLQGILKRLNEE